MNLLIIRHGIAEDREGMEDAQRKLTGQGRKRMRRQARTLHQLVPQIDVLATSPLIRAVQTGEIIAGKYDGLTPTQIAPLSPGKSPIALLNWIQKQPATATIALVGHEPGLSIFVSWMMTGLQESFIELKKGGMCALQIDGDIPRGPGKVALAAEAIPFAEPRVMQTGDARSRETIGPVASFPKPFNGADAINIGHSPLR